MRGHLELYHAFLHDTILPPIAAPEEIPVDDRDWEIVSEPREESPADVSKHKTLIFQSNLREFPKCTKGVRRTEV